MTRHESRYKAMTILYQAFLYSNNKIKYDIKEIINEQLGTNDKFISNLVLGVIKHDTELTEIANEYLDNWRIDRLGYTDQAILKMGIYELLYTNTDDLVCIDEAILLSKEYSDDKVSKMINAVLDKVYNNKDKNDK